MLGTGFMPSPCVRRAGHPFWWWSRSRTTGVSLQVVGEKQNGTKKPRMCRRDWETSDRNTQSLLTGPHHLIYSVKQSRRCGRTAFRNMFAQSRSHCGGPRSFGSVLSPSPRAHGRLSSGGPDGCRWGPAQEVFQSPRGKECSVWGGGGGLEWALLLGDIDRDGDACLSRPRL